MKQKIGSIGRLNFLLILTILSALFGCNSKSKQLADIDKIPHFPQTDNPAFKVEPYQVDAGFYVQNFIFSQDKKNVFLLACKVDTAPERISYQLLRLDQDGKVEEKLVLPYDQWTGVPGFWWEDDGRLGLRLENEFEVFDPTNFKTMETWKEIDFNNFMTQEKRDQLVYDEQVDAFMDVWHKAIDKSHSQYIRKVMNLYYMFIDLKPKPSEVWCVQNQDDIDYWIEKYGERITPMNPEKYTVDDNVSVVEVAHHFLDYKIIFPNIKDIEAYIMKLSSGKKSAQFRLSNKEGHSLNLTYADNQYMTTGNGDVWMMYEKVLYHIMVPR